MPCIPLGTGPCIKLKRGMDSEITATPSNKPSMRRRDGGGNMPPDTTDADNSIERAIIIEDLQCCLFNTPGRWTL
eukprot:m.31065 g.31065  ORF g.31065 m.31065 type:complete len:75 (+) comp8275_c0_seq1:3316-3540(+)